MWDKLTVAQYQQIHEIQKGGLDSVDKVVQTICVVFGLTEEKVNELPVDMFNAYAAAVARGITEDTFLKKAKTTIRAGAKRYRLLYEVGKLRFGQYVELQSFIKGGLIENLHLIAASISAPTKLYFLTGKNESKTHAERATDFKQANFQSLYCSVVFFCSRLADFNQKWQLPPSEEDEEDDEPPAPFVEHLGWIYSATKIAEHERIKLNEAYNLSATQAMNDLMYLRQYEDYRKTLTKKVGEAVN